ncbi:hypothetical protein Dimus_025300 [Dionaea muscipula]
MPDSLSWQPLSFQTPVNRPITVGTLPSVTDLIPHNRHRNQIHTATLLALRIHPLAQIFTRTRISLNRRSPHPNLARPSSFCHGRRESPITSPYRFWIFFNDGSTREGIGDAGDQTHESGDQFVESVPPQPKPPVIERLFIAAVAVVLARGPAILREDITMCGGLRPGPSYSPASSAGAWGLLRDQWVSSPCVRDGVVNPSKGPDR